MAPTLAQYELTRRTLTGLARKIEFLDAATLAGLLREGWMVERAYLATRMVRGEDGRLRLAEVAP